MAGYDTTILIGDASCHGPVSRLLHVSLLRFLIFLTERDIIFNCPNEFQSTLFNFLRNESRIKATGMPGYLQSSLANRSKSCTKGHLLSCVPHQVRLFLRNHRSETRLAWLWTTYSLSGTEYHLEFQRKSCTPRMPCNYFQLNPSRAFSRHRKTWNPFRAQLISTLLTHCHRVSCHQNKTSTTEATS